MSKKKKTTVNEEIDLSIVEDQPTTESDNKVKYVVIRESHRVSEAEYETPDDPKALNELEYWKGIANNHSWGEPVEIVKYNNKLHRIW